MRIFAEDLTPEFPEVPEVEPEFPEFQNLYLKIAVYTKKKMKLEVKEVTKMTEKHCYFESCQKFIIVVSYCKDCFLRVIL